MITIRTDAVGNNGKRDGKLMSKTFVLEEDRKIRGDEGGKR